MSPHEFYYKVRPLGKLLPKELEDDLHLHYIVPDCKLSSMVLPPRTSQSNNKFDSSILTTNNWNLISYWIDGGQEILPKSLKNGQYELKLLLRGSRDGFEAKDFHYKCNDKGATIVAIKLKNSNKIIGGYNPMKWSGCNKYLNTDKSFLFSFNSYTLDPSTIVLSRVRETSYAISDDDSTLVGFGRGDLHIFRKGCKLIDYSVKIHYSESFEIDEYEVHQITKKK